MTTSPAALPPDHLLLSVIPAVHPLPPALAALVTRDAVVVERPAGTVLFDRGDACPGFMVLARGVVRVTRGADGGRELLLYRVHAGEICVITLGCLLAARPYPARGVAEEDVRGLLLPGGLFQQLAAQSAPFRDAVFGALAARIDQLLDLAAQVAFEPLERRLAAALLAHVRSSGRPELLRTHAQLAAEIGSVRERVSRLLERFERQGAVRLGRGRVTVLDHAGLERIASQAPAGSPRPVMR